MLFAVLGAGVGAVVLLTANHEGAAARTKTASQSGIIQPHKPHRRTAQPRIPVPRFVGLSLPAAHNLADKHHLVAGASYVYSRSAPSGEVIGQSMPQGRRVAQASVIGLVVSRGPPPVVVPNESGLTADAAGSRARALGLVPSFVTRSSPGRTPGLVFRQSLSPDSSVHVGIHITFAIASQPEWHTVTALQGTADKSTEIFRIRGSRWRIDYTITNNLCSYGQCIGPTVYVTSGSGGLYSFDLHAASAFTNIPLPAGNYSAQVNVSDGSPQYTLTVEDYY